MVGFALVTVRLTVATGGVIAFAVTHIAPWPLTLAIQGWTLVEAPTVALVGGWIYREA